MDAMHVLTACEFDAEVESNLPYYNAPLLTQFFGSNHLLA